MIKGNFNSYKTKVLRFCVSMFLVLSTVLLCGLILSILNNFTSNDASEYIGELLITFLFSVVCVFVFSLLIGIIAIVLWFLFVPPGAVWKFIIAFVIILIVGFAILIFIQTPLYDKVCEIVKNLLDMIKKALEGK